MCLRKVKLNLTWNVQEKKFVGTGYKKLTETYLDKYKLKKWHRANGDYEKYSWWSTHHPLITDKIYSEASYHDINVNRQQYHPGFHIFLEEQAAKDYRHHDGDIYQVLFYNVLSYGTNESAFEVYRPCVVTEYMKIVRKLA